MGHSTFSDEASVADIAIQATVYLANIQTQDMLPIATSYGV